MCRCRCRCRPPVPGKNCGWINRSMDRPWRWRRGSQPFFQRWIPQIHQHICSINTAVGNLYGVLPLGEVQQRVEEDHHRQDQPERQRFGVDAALAVDAGNQVNLHTRKRRGRREEEGWGGGGWRRGKRGRGGGGHDLAKSGGGRPGRHGEGCRNTSGNTKRCCRNGFLSPSLKRLSFSITHSTLPLLSTFSRSFANSLAVLCCIQSDLT